MGDLLFLYGPSGAGKTRLLQMIAESCSEPDTVRVGCEQIGYDISKFCRDENSEGFFAKYGAVENLLVDNLWVLRSHPLAAEFMGRLISTRTAQGDLTVLASDLPYEDVLDAIPAIGACLNENDVVFLTLGKPVDKADVAPSGEPGRMVDKLKSVLGPVFEKGKDKVVAAYVFGPSVNRYFGPTIDFDLAFLLCPDCIEDADEIKMELVLQCNIALKRTDIDVVIMNRNRNIILLDDVVRNGVLLFDTDRGLREEFEVKAQHDSTDFRQHRMEVESLWPSMDILSRQ